MVFSLCFQEDDDGLLEPAGSLDKVVELERAGKLVVGPVGVDVAAVEEVVRGVVEVEAEPPRERIIEHGPRLFDEPLGGLEFFDA